MRACLHLPRIAGRKQFLLCVLLLAFFLQLARINGMSLWIDELFTLRSAREPSLTKVVAAVARMERRPPLSFVTFHAWHALVGDSEFAWRWLSAACATLAVAAAVPLAERVRSGAGVPAALLLSTSPFILLFGPMIRAYSITLLLSVLLSLLLLRGHPRAYALVAIAAIWTDYVLWSLIAVHAFWRVGITRAGPRLEARRTWWIVFSVAALAALPLLAGASDQINRDVLNADLAGTPLGVALQLSYAVYAYLVGETLFPWSPWAWLGLAGSGLALAGLRRWRKSLLLVVLSGLIPLLAIVALLTVVAADIPFVNAPSRAIVAAPMIALLLAVGLRGLPSKLSRLALAGILIAYAAALFNLYTDRSYINPIYAVPAREIAAQIEENAVADALILADSDTVLAHYVTEHRVLATNSMEALDSLQSVPPEVWLLTFGRDRTRVVQHDALVRQRLAEGNWERANAWQFVLQDPIYRQVKSRLLGREPYEAKASLERWIPRN